MSDRAFWKRWLLPRTVPARIVVVIVLLCAAWGAWRGWIWWVNARTVAWVGSTRFAYPDLIKWADPRPGDPLAEWRYHPALGTIEGIALDNGRRLVPAELRRLRWLPELRMIVDFGNHFTDEHLAQLPALPKLETLKLNVSPISDAGLETLAQRKSLLRLQLSDTGITDVGMVHLSELTRLRELWLSGTAVGDAGLRLLRPLEDLEKLSVGAPVTDAGIGEIIHFRKLQILYFFRSPVTDAGMERLMRDLSGCKEIELHRTRVSPAMAATIRAKGITVEFSP